MDGRSKQKSTELRGHDNLAGQQINRDPTHVSPKEKSANHHLPAQRQSNSQPQYPSMGQNPHPGPPQYGHSGKPLPGASSLPAYVPGGAITSQPTNQHQRMQPVGQFQPPLPIPPTPTIPGCPPGLEPLIQLDTLFVRQKTEHWEVFTGWETKNKYVVTDSSNRFVFYAKEDSSCCGRDCFGSIRAFDMVIADANGDELIHFKRPLACGSCCYPCCLQSIQIFSPPGNLIGTVEQEWSMLIPKYVVRNELGAKVLRIRGPCITCSCCSDVQFNIFSVAGGEKVGKISKKWSGLAKEIFTDADNFGIQFPLDLDVKLKATMLGACILIDFIYFEKSD